MNSDSSPDSIGFLILERAVAVIGLNLKASTEEFVASLDGEFWNHQLALIEAVPLQDLPYAHAAFVRMAVSHADEHLFGLIFAVLQAPHCPNLWLSRYKSEELYELVRRTLNGDSFPSQIHLLKPGFAGVVEAVWPNFDEEKARLTTIALIRHANRLVCELSRDEYNSLKHGLRAHMGSFSLSFAPGSSDKKPNPEDYINISDSERGCRYLAFDKIDGSKNQFTSKLVYSNWDLLEFRAAIALTALFVINIGVALRIRHKFPGLCEYKFYSNTDVYENGHQQPQIGAFLTRGAEWCIPKSGLYSEDKIRSLYDHK